MHARRPGVYDGYLQAIELLEVDPYNRRGHADIRKLEGVPVGEGQYRLRVGDYRLRCDIVGEVAVLYSFRPRREAYRRRER